MTLLEHAHTELNIADRDGDLAATPRMRHALLEVIDAFADQGHSGGSASIVGPRVGYVLRQLLAFEPITPLTGADDEWVDITEDMAGRPGLQQNARCGRVFREGGIAYDIEAVVYRERGGGGFTGWDSARRVTFPYAPASPRYVSAWLRRPERLLARLRGQLRP